MTNKILLAKAGTLEDSIAELVYQFCEDTGVTAETVDVSIELVQCLNRHLVGGKHTSLTGIKMELKL